MERFPKIETDPNKAEKMTLLQELTLLVEQEIAAQEKIHGKSDFAQAFNMAAHKFGLIEDSYKPYSSAVRKEIARKKRAEKRKLRISVLESMTNAQIRRDKLIREKETPSG
jgi:hypothetical protein